MNSFHPSRYPSHYPSCTVIHMNKGVTYEINAVMVRLPCTNLGITHTLYKRAQRRRKRRLCTIFVSSITQRPTSNV